MGSPRVPTVPLHRTLPRLLRDPLAGFEAIGRDAGYRVVRLDLGLFRPFLVTRPEHVQHVLRDNAGNYLRDGMMWAPLRRLFGNGLAGVGATWAARRALVAPMLTGRQVDSIVDAMGVAIRDAVSGLPSGQPLDATVAMTRIVQQALIHAFFGGRISTVDSERLGRAIATAFTSLGARMLLPFLPERVPLPGDRAFRRAVRVVDEVMLPLVAQARHRPHPGDIVSVLAQARDTGGAVLDDRQVRDDVVALFVAGSETTAVALTWLWVLLDRNPEVAGRLRDEVTVLVGDRIPAPRQLASLRYTRLVIQELLRLYPVGWLIPRTARAADDIDGVPVPAGATVLLSPYLTHRMPELWEAPETFDPLRFSAARSLGRHRFAYFPFSSGPHQCLGSRLFEVEAMLVVAAVLARHHPVLSGPSRLRPRPAVTLRPRQRVRLTLLPSTPPPGGTPG